MILKVFIYRTKAECRPDHRPRPWDQLSVCLSEPHQGSVGSDGAPIHRHHWMAIGM